MKLNKNKCFLTLFISGALLTSSFTALALTGDTEKPIEINSAAQSLDMPNNTVTFTGSVVVKQGSIEVKADKVVVIRPNGESGKEIIEAFGAPATFYQMQDNGKPVQGSGQHMRYELQNELVTLSGDASLEQLDSNVKADRITYLVKQQQMEAFSDKNKRVTTVLLPGQLQNKTPKPAGK